MLAGLRTVASRETSRPRFVSDNGFCAKAAAKLSVRGLMVPSEGLLAPCAQANRSFVSCCFSTAVTEELAWMAARSACNLARFCFSRGVGAVEAVGVLGWEGWAGWGAGLTPCRT